MFTGIVNTVGEIQDVKNGVKSGVKTGVKKGVARDVKEGVELRIKASYKGVKKGESIAVNGACLTVERVVKGGFTVHAVATTLGRMLIGEWRKGRVVNLERAARG
jgi:riboflavin synthase